MQPLAAAGEAGQFGFAADSEFQAAHDALGTGGSPAPLTQLNDECQIEDCQHSENACINHVHMYIRTDVNQS